MHLIHLLMITFSSKKKEPTRKPLTLKEKEYLRKRNEEWDNGPNLLKLLWKGHL